MSNSIEVRNLEIKLRTLEIKNKGALYALCLEEEICKAWDGSQYLKDELQACMNAKYDLRRGIK
jgi:hypothetical protein